MISFFFFNDTATTEIYTLFLHDALPILHWMPWSDAAFARARAERKPILLDIGAVWCHWCHVMDGESYEDPRVAEILNRDFVCIKVDQIGRASCRERV